MRIPTLRANGLVLPSIYASLVKAFRSLQIEVLDLPFPNPSDHFRSFVESAQRRYQAIFTLDLGVEHTFMLNINDLQLSLRIPLVICFVDALDEAKEMRERYLASQKGAQKRGEKAMRKVLAH